MSAGTSDRSYSRMFRIDDSPIVEVDTIRRGPLALTHLRCEHPNHGKTAPYAAEATYMVSLQLRQLPSHPLRCNGRRVPLEAYAENTLTIYDLREQWRAELLDPFEVVHLHIPQYALTTLHEDCGSRKAAILSCAPTNGKVDGTLRHLVEAMRPALAGITVPRLFSEHVMLAMCEHVAMRYGGLHPHASIARGSLAPWQQRRAREYLLDHMARDVSLEEVAKACNLSVSHFARAFRRAIGTTPHQWLTARRLEMASRLLCGGMSLADVATECGFSDQSHFTRVFSRGFGVPPGQWRKMHIGVDGMDRTE